MTSSPLLDGAVRLHHWGVIRAQGADAAAFLHGQLTSDFAMLDTTEARLAGYCSAKGRLLASFIGWKRSDEELLLACSADLLQPTLKRLSMFVLRAKCKLTDASAEWPLWGVAGPSAAGWLGASQPWRRGTHQGAEVIRLPDAAGVPRALVALPADAPAPALPEVALAVWQWAETASGVARIEAATVDRFVPQMLNYEVLGGVDFKKGCYPGQEIVARSQYRGTIKRRSFLFTSEAPMQAGQEIFHSADPAQPAGLVANAAPAPQGGSLALVELKLAALDAGSLHLGAADGPALVRGELPYELPVEAG